MTPEPGRDARRRRWAGFALVAAVFVAGLAIAAGGALTVSRVEQRHAARLMDRYTDDIGGAVTDQVENYRDLATDLAVSLGAQSDLTADDFAAITSGLTRDRLPGLSGLGFAVPAADAEVPVVQAYWRGQGATGLTLVPVGSGTEHVLVVLNRSLDGQSAAGRDLSQAPALNEVLGIARRTGGFALSEPYVLIKDQNLPVERRQTSFSLAVPVFAQHGTPDAGGFRGWLVLGVRGGDFLEETLRTHARGAVGVQLSEGKVIAVLPAAGNGDGSLRRDRVLRVGQRSWRLLVTPAYELLTPTDRRMPELTFAAGAVITLLLAGLVGILANARNRAMGQVDAATAALRLDIERRRETEARLRERESELRHLAFHDPLTGLANRVLFYERVDHALRTHARSGRPLAVLFIDLDGFKEVNDTLGHTAGDAVLQEVARRLTACLRTGDTVARFGGDEFAVVAEDLATRADVQVAADRIVAAVERPIDAGGTLVTVTASVGVALNDPGAEVDDIVRAADAAMYRAKTTGKGRAVLSQ
ncbi:sensor domain-containing diguanylate cyclase [Dactylosporangium sp. NPDC005555]|uniref:sensor domain-containing diguanylate cyclase n=1 Tax=Dactylosporangium sp. NPDC005555 TaxID=3154889 RepID=UPI0033A63A18